MGAARVNLAKYVSLGKLKIVGNWNMGKIDLPKSSNKWKTEHLDTARTVSLEHQNLCSDRSSTRVTLFSEQKFNWKLPIGEDNLVSDALQISKDLVVATVNPMKLYHVKRLMENEDIVEIDLENITRNFKFSRNSGRDRLKLSHIGENWVAVHNETNGSTIFVNLDEKTALSENSDSLSDFVLKYFNGSNLGSRMAPSNGKYALVYERNGQNISIYSIKDNDLITRQGSVPFSIDRIFPQGPDQWIIVSDKNEIYSFEVENEDVILKKLDHDVRGMKSPFSGKYFEKKFVLVSDPYYYLQGELNEQRNEVEGILRNHPKQCVESKRPYYFNNDFNAKFLDPTRHIVFLNNTIIRMQSNWDVPADSLTENQHSSRIAGFLEVIDINAKQMCYIPVPKPTGQNYRQGWTAEISPTEFIITKWGNDMVLTIDRNGVMRSFDLTSEALSKSYNNWRNMISKSDENMRMEFEKEEKYIDLQKLDTPKLGKIDPDNLPHVGGNQWMGGTGGYNTAGLGGVGGPFRMDAGHDVQQMPDSVKQQVPEHILRKAREIAKVEYAKKLKEINMSEYEADAYDGVWNKVKGHSRKLKSVIEQLEAKKKEREWAKHQTSGDLDDGKLIEGVTGEQNIYRRRIDKPPDPGAPQTKAKRLKLCFDLSGSMYRFNGLDRRLNRTLEAALMMVEALDGNTDKVEYDIVGHSGESAAYQFVSKKNYPKNNKERLVLLKSMLAHSQYCMTGDNTVECIEAAVKELAKNDDYDESVVILVSDANLERYGIRPSELKNAMTKEQNVNSFVIFIGSLYDQAERLLEELPAGKSFVLKDTKDLPKIIETIFASTMSE